ncbi:hypothetical protein JKP88DRAFT_245165 [Tribonema minus]|uniref:Uncharacterized protein n=1 Tax=Tribonema minus TaxID=303371 RepID=A0A835YY23_9STRA|nr:hypothetical protein JKP88DRAFT_245165 [Tribonema minus]
MIQSGAADREELRRLRRLASGARAGALEEVQQEKAVLVDYVQELLDKIAGLQAENAAAQGAQQEAECEEMARLHEELLQQSRELVKTAAQRGCKWKHFKRSCGKQQAINAIKPQARRPFRSVLPVLTCMMYAALTKFSPHALLQTLLSQLQTFGCEYSIAQTPNPKTCSSMHLKCASDALYVILHCAGARIGARCSQRRAVARSGQAVGAWARSRLVPEHCSPLLLPSHRPCSRGAVQRNLPVRSWKRHSNASGRMAQAPRSPLNRPPYVPAPSTRLIQGRQRVMNLPPLLSDKESSVNPQT